MRTVIEIEDSSDDEKPAPATSSSKPKAGKAKTNLNEDQPVDNPNRSRVKIQLNEFGQIVISPPTPPMKPNAFQSKDDSYRENSVLVPANGKPNPKELMLNGTRQESAPVRGNGVEIENNLNQNRSVTAPATNRFKPKKIHRSSHENTPIASSATNNQTETTTTGTFNGASSTETPKQHNSSIDSATRRFKEVKIYGNSHENTPVRGNGVSIDEDSHENTAVRPNGLKIRNRSTPDRLPLVSTTSKVHRVETIDFLHDDNPIAVSSTRNPLEIQIDDDERPTVGPATSNAFEVKIKDEEDPVVVLATKNLPEVQIKNESNQDNLVVISANNPVKDEDNSLVVSATKIHLKAKIEDELIQSNPVMAETSAEVKIKDDPNEDKPEVVSATNRPDKSPRSKVKKEEDDPVSATNTESALTGFVDQSIFADVDINDESGEEFGEEYEMADADYVGIAHVNGVQHFVCEGFRIRQIPEPLVVKRSLHDLNACIVANSIILDPEYQRDVIWDEGRQSALITSILMGYFIPPIIFNVKKAPSPENGVNQIKWLRICVDGKQRLTSVWKFMAGKIGFFDSSTPQRKWYFCHRIEEGRQVIDPSRNILPKPVRDFFRQQYFCCYEYNALDADTEETMFQLVQRGVALSSAEKMRAMSTTVAKYIKEYEDEYEMIMSLSRSSRGSAFRLILTIYTMIQEVTPYVPSKRKKNTPPKSAPVLRASPSRLHRVLDDKNAIDPALNARFKALFDRYESLVELCSEHITTTRTRIKRNSVFDANPQFLYQEDFPKHTKTFSPLELFVVGILLAVHMDHRTDEELLSDIAAFRIFIRKHHKDLRINSQCWASSWAFVSTEMDKRLQNPDLVIPAPAGIPDFLDPKKKFLFSSTEKQGKSGKVHPARHRAGSSSSLSDVPSELMDDLEDEEMEDHFRPGPSTRKQKRRSKGKGKEKRVSKRNARDMDDSTPPRSSRSGKRQKNRRVVEEDEEEEGQEVDYSAEFPNLDL